MKPEVLLILLITLIAQNPETIQPDVQLGYSPFDLFDADMGTPTYLVGESLWAFSNLPVLFTLKNPIGKDVASKQLQDGPVLVYSFKKGDPEGIWLLLVKDRTRTLKTYPVIFLKPEPPIASFEHYFSLSNGSLTVSGSLNLDHRPEFPSSVVLIKGGARNYTKVLADEDWLKIRLYHDVKENRIAFYFDLKKNISILAWAELVVEVPLLKLVDERSYILTFVKHPVIKSKKLTMTFPKDVNQSLRLGLEEGSRQGLGYWPVRYGEAELILNLQMNDTIRLIKTPIYILPSVIGAEVIGVQPFMPLESVKFSFNDLDLSGADEYDLLFITKVYGVQIFRSVKIRPPLATVFVYNALLDRVEGDFELIPKAQLQTLKVGEALYVLVPEEGIAFSYDIVYNGIRLKDDEYSPKLLQLKPQDGALVKIKAGHVAFRTGYDDGEPVESGFITIKRIEGLESKALSISDGWANTTLPLGSYEAIAQVNGQIQRKAFSVEASEALVSFIFDKTRIEANAQAFTISDEGLLMLAFSVMAVEAIIAYKVWKRALRAS
ncbi:MAG: hypothetical protein QW815_03585 [Nitrososphaerota archaeon]